MTKTTTPAAELPKRTARREETYALLQKDKRDRDGHDQHIEALKGEAVARRHSHPEEHGGPDDQFAPKPGTESAKRDAELRALIAEGNPHEAAVDKAAAAYRAAELAERGFRARNLEQIISDENADLAEDDAELRAAWLQVAELTRRRLAKADVILGMVTGTTSLTAQHLSLDARVRAWHEYATEAAEQSLNPPGLNDAGRYALDLVVKEAERSE